MRFRKLQQGFCSPYFCIILNDIGIHYYKDLYRLELYPVVKNVDAQNNAFIYYGSKKLMNFLYFTLSGVKLPMTLSSHNYNTKTLSYLTASSLTALISVSALAGISLAFLVESTENVDYGFRVASEVENLMTSVERVMTYTKLDAEVGYSSEIHPPDSWPKKGTIHIKDLSFRYTESWPLVLKDINLFIADKEKVGVVGRTGAGKSSLVASLLRMPDPEGKVTRLAYNVTGQSYIQVKIF